MKIFERLESNVRAYCRSFPDVFDRAKGSILYSESGKEYIDFLSGAGALNLGHNNEFIKREIMDYIMQDRITHGLDLYTKAKREFLGEFDKSILKPRGLDYKIQFCGPTGTNAVEAALKLARKVKKRSNIFSFMGGFHGVSLGSLCLTGNKKHRSVSGVPLTNVTFIPYPGKADLNFDTIEYMEYVLTDDHSGIETPAAIILETVQGEGGVFVAHDEWLRRLAKLCKKHDILLICDDIQVGCGRTGSFLSFEDSNIVPDMVVLSKSISGYGLPMSIVLMKPELDIWQAGEHSGTFRGNQLAFVAAAASIRYINDKNILAGVKEKEAFLKKYLSDNIANIGAPLEIRGKGMIWGIDLLKIGGSLVTEKIIFDCFDEGLIIERCGSMDSVIKIFPPLTTEIELLEKGCSILLRSIMKNLGL